MLGIFVYRGAYFGLYDLTKDLAGGNFMLKFLIAQGVTMASGAVSYCFSTVQARMMMQAGRSAELVQYSGMLDCFRKIIKEEGSRKLLSGFSIQLFLSVSGAMSLVIYDAFKNH